MPSQCDICPNIIYKKEEGTFYDQNRVVTSPGYWEYQFTTKSTSFEEKMLQQYLVMLSKDASGFTVCSNCKAMLEKDTDYAHELGIEKYVKSVPGGKVDLNSAGIVMGSVWKKLRGSWPESIKVKGFNTSTKEDNKKEKKDTPNPSKKSSSSGNGKNIKSNKQKKEISKTPVILDSVIKKAEENGWAKILQDQIKEFDKRNKDIEKKIDNIDKRLKSLPTSKQKSSVNFISVLSLIFSCLLIVAVFIVNNRINYQYPNSNAEIIKKNDSTDVRGNYTARNSNTNASSHKKMNVVTKSRTKIHDRKNLPVKKTISKLKNGSNVKPEKQLQTNLVSVPNLKGINISDAESELNSAELKVTIIKVSLGQENVNKVINQIPAAGQSVKKGTTIILQVGK